MAIKQVGVIGCGLMGSGIAQVVAQAGFPTIVVEANDALLERGLGGLRATPGDAGLPEAICLGYRLYSFGDGMPLL